MKAWWTALAWLACTGPACAAGFDFGPPSWIHPGNDAQKVVVGDVNGDALDDVLLTISVWHEDEYSNTFIENSLLVYLQRSNGTLAAPLKFDFASASIDVALADLNEDGVLDILTGGNTYPNYDGAPTAYLVWRMFDRAKGDFVSQVVRPGLCDTVGVLDANLDGHLDAICHGVTGGYDGFASLFHGDGRGDMGSQSSMATITTGHDVYMRVGDVTGDGRADLVFHSESDAHFYVFVHAGSDAFSAARSYAAPSPTKDLAIADFNRDGRNDVLLSVDDDALGPHLLLYAQNAAGELLAPSRLASEAEPYRLIAADLDRDGDQDVLVGHPWSHTLGRYLRGPAGFAPEALSDMPEGFIANLAGGDIDDDGCTDALLTDVRLGLAVLHGRNCRRARAANDFNGDGKSDLLWRNPTSGENALWPSADANLAEPLTRVYSAAWRIAGSGDFNGDGKSDLLWHNFADGSSVIWRSADYANQQPMTRISDLSWEIAGIGDFNSDGVDDVLWRNRTSGRNAIWRAANFATQQSIGAVTDLHWKVVGVADFDGDRRADILWRHDTTGANAIWLAGSSSRRLPVTGVTKLSWVVAAAADFDGDGKADILWRSKKSGVNIIWRGASSSARMPASPMLDLQWKIAAVGDYNGNGKADVLWRHSATGADMIWRSAQTAVRLTVANVTDPGWQVVSSMDAGE